MKKRVKYVVPCRCTAGEAVVTRSEWVSVWKELETEARRWGGKVPPRTRKGRIPSKKGEYTFEWREGWRDDHPIRRVTLEIR